MKIPFFDSLTNFVANLGTSRDKAAASFYAGQMLNDQQLSDTYRVAWLPRKIVDSPPLDATRNWRGWKASKAQIEALEAEEKRLGLRGKVREALQMARLYGGAAIVIGAPSSGEDLSQPLNPGSVGRGGLPYLVVMSRLHLKAGELEQNPLSPEFGRPKWYEPTNAAGVHLHPSRVVRFVGAPVPASLANVIGADGWGDSILQSVYSACTHFDSTMANVASLVFEAKVDVFKIPDLMQNMGDQKYRERLLNRFGLAATMKGINGALILDEKEGFESKTQAFSGLDSVIDRFMQTAAGAADIPLTRLMGVGAKGLGNVGDSDTTNYYDKISSMQELEISPAMAILDECLIRSALGGRPAEVHFEWRSLWQSTPKERADIGKTVADTIKIIAETSLFAPDALGKAAENALVEVGSLPGLEEAAAEIPRSLADALPQSLYVSRKVLNGEAILAHFEAQGVVDMLAPGDLHVTIAYSRTPVDWMQISTPWYNESDGKLSVPAGGPRMMDKFGDATVLLFNSWQLSQRHGDILEIGASWDHEGYQPHITIAYNSPIDIAGLKPYTGPIELGPEIFEQLDTSWSEGKA